MTIALFILGWFCLFLIIRWLWQKTVADNISSYFFPSLAFKLLAGFCFGMVYTFYYQAGDTLFHFASSSRLNDLFNENALKYFRVLFGYDASVISSEPRAAFFIRIQSIINLLSLNNYWISTLFISVSSFIVVWVLILRIIKAYNIDIRLVLASLIFFPSVAFWTSGLVKETISYASMCMIIWAAIPIYKYHSIKWKEVVLGVISFVILWKLKYYHAAVIITMLIPLLFYSVLKLKGLNTGQSVIIVLITSMLCALFVSNMHYNLALQRVLEVIVENNALLTARSDPQKVIVFQNLQPTLLSLTNNWPAAVFLGLFGPLPWESWNILSLLQSLESMTLLLLFIVSIKFWKRKNEMDMVLVIFVLAYILIMASLLAYSTPNYGTLSRYKVAYLPMLIYFILQFLPFSSWLKKIRPSK